MQWGEGGISPPDTPDAETHILLAFDAAFYRWFSGEVMMSRLTRNLAEVEEIHAA